MRSLVKILSSFFVKKTKSVITPIWGLIPLSEMNGDQLLQFVDELSASATALSIMGFDVVYDMTSEPVIEIRGVNV